MGELKVLKRPEPPALVPDKHVVGMCKDLLAKAEAGHLRAIGFVYENSDGMGFDQVGMFDSVTQAVGLCVRLTNLIDALDDEDEDD